MIVLRIDVHGHSGDVRWAGAEATLGSGETAAIQRDDAGWAAREAVLVHLGSEVLVVRADGRGEIRLRLGDTVKIGDATVTVVGLLPLAAGAPTPVPAPPTAPFELEPEPSRGPLVVADADPVVARPGAAREGATSSEAAASGALASSSPAAAASEGAPHAKPPRFRDATRTFDEELWAVVKRSPWWLLSGAIHALLLLTLSLLSPESTVKARADALYGIVAADAAPQQPFESGGPLDRAEPDRTPEEVRAPEFDETPVLESMPTDRPPADAAHTDVEPEALPDDEAQAPPVLLGPSAAATSLRISEKTVLPKKPAGPVDLAKVNDDAQRALEVNRKAAARVRDAIARGGGALGKALRGLRTEDILVVKGSFDHMEIVLEELSIPFTLRAPHELIDEDDLSAHKVIFWNCGETVLAPRHQTKIVQRLREFVREGGYLFTTDWAISNIVMPAFPGVLATKGREKPLPEMIVVVTAASGSAGHTLLDGVMTDEATPRWWLESASFDVEVVRHEGVDVLLEAPELTKPPFGRSPVIAVTFTYGRGRVLHVMGHYYQQKGNVAGAIGIQRLPLNFVRMRFE